ncbi:hypothetical protein E2C01_035697 [Portunus trituberculatus]|uniref:Uncharacterized protein n=1 Tax=Portunus trituberculatus TaxID=210409 RepID=A0A5B7FAF7_PORTR|nr:hypothetical protein [Portunus trituberculatus]
MQGGSSKVYQRKDLTLVFLIPGIASSGTPLSMIFRWSFCLHNGSLLDVMVVGFSDDELCR